MKRLTDIAVPIAPEERVSITDEMVQVYKAAFQQYVDSLELNSNMATVHIGVEGSRAGLAAFAAAFLSSAKEPQIDPLVAYLERQWAWSKETFGPALRTAGVIQHIRKELGEIEADPHDLMEWVDVVILAMDGFWRHGGKPVDLLRIMQAKQDKNMARTWPDWRTMGEDQAIEHDRSHDAPALPSSGGGHE